MEVVDCAGGWYSIANLITFVKYVNIITSIYYRIYIIFIVNLIACKKVDKKGRLNSTLLKRIDRLLFFKVRNMVGHGSHGLAVMPRVNGVRSPKPGVKGCKAFEYSIMEEVAGVQSLE